MKVFVELGAHAPAPRRVLEGVRDIEVVGGADDRIRVDGAERPLVILPRPDRGPAADLEVGVDDLARRVPPDAVGLVVAGTIPAAEREAIERAGLSWCDGRGALHLAWPGTYVHVDRSVRRPEQPKPKGAEGIGPASIRAVQVLLGSDQEAWTVSQLAQAAAVSVGQAHTVLRVLERNQLLRREGKGPSQRSTVTDRRAALDWLRTVDRARRRPAAAATYIYGRTPDDEMRNFAALADEAGLPYAVTGAAASNLMGMPVLTRVPVAHVRVGGLDAPDALHRLGLEHLDAEGVARGMNLELWTDVGELGTFGAQEWDGVKVAPPVRVWLDIGREGGRGEDAAQMFREHILERA